jgi:alpha-L-rhamnosidase
VFCKTAAFNRQVDNFLAKWLKDLKAEQFPNGAVPFVVPNVLGDAAGAAGWSDAATVIPWNMYQVYGDERLLEEQYSSMKNWIDYMANNSKNGLWNKGFQFGDWLSYRTTDLIDRSALTDVYLCAQAYFAHSTQLLINTATVLNKKEDVEKYTQLLQTVKDAFYKEYVTPGGRLASNTQTAYVLALQFDLLPEELRATAAKRLTENITSYKDHLTTGFLGTSYLPHVLSRFGYTDTAYKLLLQDTYPSWLYPVKMGATTIWERWDGIKQDSSFQTTDMNSFNHYAYGAIGDWMYKEIAGIDMDAPGYKKIKIMPHPGGGLSSVNASLKTYYGKISVAWKIKEGKFEMDVQIPANTTADIYIPEGATYKKVSVGSGSYHF